MTLVEDINKRIDEIIKSGDATTLEQINTELRKVSSTARLNIMRDIKNNREHNRIIIDARTNHVKTYQMWQALWQEAIDLERYDNTVAKMKDVDRACMNVYTLLLKMIGSLNTALIEQGEAINRIEEKLGMEVTDFAPKEGGSNDVQRDKGSD